MCCPLRYPVSPGSFLNWVVSRSHDRAIRPASRILSLAHAIRATANRTISQHFAFARTPVLRALAFNPTDQKPANF